MISSFLSSVPQFFAAIPSGCSNTFFGIPPWYKYLQLDPATCEVVNFELLGNGADSGIILIALAIIDMMLRVAGIVAVVFVIWGGFNFMTSQAEPDKLAQARHTILDALIGLGLSIMATSIVVFVGNRLAPTSKTPSADIAKNLPNPSADAGRIVEFANVAISIFAAVAVLVIVVAGFRYIIAKGEPQALTQAKNMIVYALIGLAVCVMAFAIVNFVIGRV